MKQIALLALIALAWPAYAEARVYTPKSSFAAGVEVKVGQKTLFRVYGSVGEFDPAERAAAIAARIEKLVIEGRTSDDIKVIEREGNMVVQHRRLTLVVVTQKDAQPLKKPATEVANQYKNAIGDHLDKAASGEIVSTFTMTIFALIVIMGIYLLVYIKSRKFRELK